MGYRHFANFFLLSFVISWGVPGVGLGLAHFFPTFPFRLEMYTPFYYIGVWGPAIAALIVIGCPNGLPGIRAYAGRMLDWRLGAHWWLFALLGIPGRVCFRYPFCNRDAVLGGQVIVTGIVAALMLVLVAPKWLKPENAATWILPAYPEDSKCGESPNTTPQRTH